MMNKTKIAFIVNSSPTIGSGHVYRCLAVAADENFQKEIETVFLLPEGSASKNLIKRHGFEVVITPDYHRVNYHKYIKDLVSRESVEIVLLDLTEQDLMVHSFLVGLKDLLISSITMFDYQFPRFEDITFYPGLDKKGVSEFKGLNGKVVKQYSGVDYFVFRAEFNQLFIRSFQATDNHVLLTMGGADPWEFTELAMSGLELIPFAIHCTLLLPVLSKRVAQLEELAKVSKHTYTLLEHTSDIARVMAEADLAVINGGLTRYEVAVVGTPFMAISVHELQYEITERITRGGASLNLGLGSDLTPSDVGTAATRLLTDPSERKRMSDKLKGQFDCFGHERILKKLLKARASKLKEGVSI